MAGFVSGDVVVVPFPFTDLSTQKRRPAIVVASFTRGDLLICQVTSTGATHPVSLPLTHADFAHGGLPRASFALPHRLVTVHQSIVLRAAGRLTPPAVSRLIDLICETIRGNATTDRPLT